MKSILLHLFKICCTGILLIIAYKYFSPDLSIEILLEGNTVYILLAAMAFLMQYVIAALRWGKITQIKAPHISRFALSTMFLKSLFFTIITPGGVGSDLAKIFLLRRRNIDTSLAISLIIADKIITIIGLLLLILVPWTLLIFADPSVVAFGCVVGSLIGLIVIRAIFNNYVLLKIKQNFQRINKYIVPIFMPIMEVINSKKIAIIIFYSVSSGVCFVIVGLFISNAYYPNNSILPLIIAVPIGMLAGVIPITYSGWGIRELVFGYVYSEFGMNGDQGVLISIVFGALMIVTTLPFGVYLMRSQGERPLND